MYGCLTVNKESCTMHFKCGYFPPCIFHRIFAEVSVSTFENFFRKAFKEEF